MDRYLYILYTYSRLPDRFIIPSPLYGFGREKKVNKKWSGSGTVLYTYTNSSLSSSSFSRAQVSIFAFYRSAGGQQQQQQQRRKLAASDKYGARFNVYSPRQRCRFYPRRNAIAAGFLRGAGCNDAHRDNVCSSRKVDNTSQQFVYKQLLYTFHTLAFSRRCCIGAEKLVSARARKTI
ncbi:unnamed protein product, partial [Trichogramma brassicae]